MRLIFQFLYIFVLKLVLIDCQLYSKQDNVTIFKPESFNNTFFEKPADNWFVQFYHSYCGHCINFAPKFKQFLAESKHWSNVIRFGVIDCSQYKDTCNSQQVNYYPFFKMYLKNGLNGSNTEGFKISVPHNNVDELYMGVIQNIELIIKPEQLIETRPDRNVTEKEYLLVVGDDLVSLKRTVLTFTGRLTYPLFFRHETDKKGYDVLLVNGTSSASHGVSDLAELYRWLSQYRNQTSESRIYQPYGTDAPRLVFVPNANTSDPSVVVPRRSSIIAAVYNQDIYSSIYYAFTNDISDSVLTNINDVVILQNFVEKLYLYSDLSDRFTDNFKQLLDLMTKKIEEMRSRSKFAMNWPDLLRQAKFPVIQPSWIGCNGTLPHLRRYPCGLWTMFHTLTVNHHVKVTSKQIKNDDSLDLIRSIREFVITFFACRECAENFERETTSFESRSTTSSRAVIYLWQVHNSVNRRLSGAPSEDPLHPKVAFPSERACPSCRLRRGLQWPLLSQWNFPEVLLFLEAHFSGLNRVPFLTPTALLLPAASRWQSGRISALDLSLCVLLSLSSLFVVVALFVRLWLSPTLCALRRRPRRTPLLA